MSPLFRPFSSSPKGFPRFVVSSIVPPLDNNPDNAFLSKDQILCWEVEVRLDILQSQNNSQL